RWRDRLPGAKIRADIAWLAERVEWMEEAAVEERWLSERNDALLRALEDRVVATVRRGDPGGTR
ncbi:MAG TPA: hypothetical protein VD814_00375, partial [Nocardioides sp.]|nr:hypothetical protein [Nocardioides sp.]